MESQPQNPEFRNNPENFKPLYNQARSTFHLFHKDNIRSTSYEILYEHANLSPNSIKIQIPKGKYFKYTQTQN